MPKLPVPLQRTVRIVLAITFLAAPGRGEEETPPGVEQILPRGQIPAVFEPQFVSSGAAEVPPDAWVLGVVIDGDARAYSLNLLNRHEVVNDRVGERSFAAVWWPLANTAVVYDRTINDKTLNFEASGALRSASLVMRDRETDSWWSIMSSDAIGGSLAGARLTELPVGEKTTYGDWIARFPETRVLSIDGQEHIDSNPYDNYFSSDGTFRDLGIEDTRLPPKTPVFAFWIEGDPYAAPFDAFEGGRIFRLDNGRRLLLTRPENSPIFLSSRAYLLDDGMRDDASAGEILDALDRTGRGATAVAGFDTYWYTWAAVNDGTGLLR